MQHTEHHAKTLKLNGVNIHVRVFYFVTSILFSDILITQII